MTAIYTDIVLFLTDHTAVEEEVQVLLFSPEAPDPLELKLDVNYPIRSKFCISFWGVTS